MSNLTKRVTELESQTAEQVKTAREKLVGFLIEEAGDLLPDADLLAPEVKAAFRIAFRRLSCSEQILLATDYTARLARGAVGRAGR